MQIRSFLLMTVLYVPGQEVWSSKPERISAEQDHPVSGNTGQHLTRIETVAIPYPNQNNVARGGPLQSGSSNSGERFPTAPTGSAPWPSPYAYPYPTGSAPWPNQTGIQTSSEPSSGGAETFRGYLERQAPSSASVGQVPVATEPLLATPSAQAQVAPVQAEGGAILLLLNQNFRRQILKNVRQFLS